MINYSSHHPLTSTKVSSSNPALETYKYTLFLYPLYCTSQKCFEFWILKCTYLVAFPLFVMDLLHTSRHVKKSAFNSANLVSHIHVHVSTWMHHAFIQFSYLFTFLLLFDVSLTASNTCKHLMYLITVLLSILKTFPGYFKGLNTL